MKAKPSFFLFNKRNFRKPARSSAVIRERHGDRSLRVEHVVTGRFRMAGILDDSPAVWLIGATVEQSEGEAMESGTYFLMREDTETKGPPTRETVVNVTQAEKKSDGALRLNPRSLTSSFLSRVIGACLAVLLWGADAQAQDEVAALLNLSPWRSYVHLFCDKTGGADCAVTFRCGQQSGAPVTWPVEVEPSRIFTYWPNKTDGFGRPAGLEAALVNAGLTSTEARRRTTCTVRSDDPVEARAYTFFAGELTPVANIVPRAGDDNKVATLLNLSPWRSYVHLFCDKTGGADCAVTFRCGQQSGAPVTWPVEVEPSRIFTYWPNKTDGAGRPAGLEAALVNAGLTSTEARRRTTCTVRSDDPVKARAYTFIAGKLIPVANVNTGSGLMDQPEPTDVALSNLVVSTERDITNAANYVRLVPSFDSDTTSYEATVPNSIARVFVSPSYESLLVSHVTVNSSRVHNSLPSEAIPLSPGQTTTISIVVTGIINRDTVRTRTYTVAVTRQEATPIPPSGSNQGRISFVISDQCNDGYRINYRFFEFRDNGVQTRVWPAQGRQYYTRSFGEEYTSHLQCTVGRAVCLGGHTGSYYWGRGINGNQRPRVPTNSGNNAWCWECAGRPTLPVRLGLTCPPNN